MYLFLSLLWVTLCKILPKTDNFFVMLHIHVYNSLQKVFEVSEKKIFLGICSCSYSEGSPPIHQSHVYGQIKNLQTIFEKGHSRSLCELRIGSY